MKVISKILTICVLFSVLFILNSFSVMAEPGGSIISPYAKSVKTAVSISESLVDVSASPEKIIKKPL